MSRTRRWRVLWVRLRVFAAAVAVAMACLVTAAGDLQATSNLRSAARQGGIKENEGEKE